VTTVRILSVRRPREVTAMADRSAPTYRQLLEEAQELGRADGRFAAAFEPAGCPGGGTPRCLGRTPAEFPRLLWDDRQGSPPSGLERNAPLWYAAGFAEALEAWAVPQSRAADWARTRRMFT
jgi:hypothetical protein